MKAHYLLKIKFCFWALLFSIITFAQNNFQIKYSQQINTVLLNVLDSNPCPNCYYYWEFGNSETAYGPSVQVTYKDPGKYLVYVYKIDSINKTIQIENKEIRITYSAEYPSNTYDFYHYFFTKNGNFYLSVVDSSNLPSDYSYWYDLDCGVGAENRPVLIAEPGVHLHNFIDIIEIHSFQKKDSISPELYYYMTLPFDYNTNNDIPCKNNFEYSFNYISQDSAQINFRCNSFNSDSSILYFNWFDKCHVVKFKSTSSISFRLNNLDVIRKTTLKTSFLVNFHNQTSDTICKTYIIKNPYYVTGIQEATTKKPSWSVYPNPTSNLLYFQSLRNTDAWVITDIYGNTVSNNMHLEYNCLNISELSSGIYFLRIYSINQSQVFKIIKE